MSMLTRDAGTAGPAVRGPGQPAPAQAISSGVSESPAPHRPGEAPVAGQSVADARPAEQITPSGVATQQPGGLAALRERARSAQTQLGDQQLPIANQSSRLILKLLGG